jgi:Leucine-rich repeat (LRR) protein
LEKNKLININDLENLKSITLLNLRENMISDISALSNLLNIIKLDLKGNHIININPLKYLVNISNINLRVNELKSLPEWILDFNLPIKWDFDYSNSIFLSRNPLEHPPIEVIKKGNKAIRAYFKKLRKESEDNVFKKPLFYIGLVGFIYFMIIVIAFFYQVA